MFYTINGNTADEAWLCAAAAFNTGLSSQQASRIGQTDEVLHAAITIKEPRQRWVLSRVPVLNPAFCMAEVIWIMCGRNDSAFLTYFNRQLPKFAGDGPKFHGAYGYRLRNHFGIDQLDRAYQALRGEPNSRQIVLQIWDSRNDLPSNNGLAAARDIPCNVVALLKVRNRLLEWTQIMRSNDLFLGLPHNIIQFTSLQEILAGWLGLEPAEYHHYSDSLHIYASNEDEVNQALPAELIHNPDTLNLPKEESDHAFVVLEALVIKLIDHAIEGKSLLQALDKLRLPIGYTNMACILVAEGLRRRKGHDLMEDALSRCTNPVYLSIFRRWLARMDRLRMVERK